MSTTNNSQRKKKNANDLDKQFKDGQRLAFLAKINKKFQNTTKKEEYKDWVKSISDSIVKKNVEVIKTTEGECMPVYADPKTHEMRRDL